MKVKLLKRLRKESIKKFYLTTLNTGNIGIYNSELGGVELIVNYYLDSNNKFKTSYIERDLLKCRQDYIIREVKKIRGKN